MVCNVHIQFVMFGMQLAVCNVERAAGNLEFVICFARFAVNLFIYH